MTHPDQKEQDLTPTQVIRLATEAEGYLELELVDRAMLRARRLLDSAAGRQAGLALMAECLRCRHRYGEAIPLLEEALEQTPEDQPLWVNLGWCHKRNGRLDLAIRAMEGLLRHSPHSGVGQYNLSCYLALAGDKEGCLDRLQKALRLDPELRKLIPQEPDFDDLREDRDFRAAIRS